ncbi:MAG: hypothetical protein ACLVBP_09955 [Ruminococcus sp.]
MMKNTFNAMLKNRPKENDEQNAIDFILAEYKDISDGIEVMIYIVDIVASHGCCNGCSTCTVNLECDRYRAKNLEIFR